MMHRILGMFIGLTAIGLALFFLTGFYVIQPLGILPEGATIWFFRPGSGLPFVSSADGILLDAEGGVSLLGRMVALGELVPHVTKRQILRVGYSRWLYRRSTGGVEFDR
ncbi:MAG: hypothetical protein JXB46_06275 [Candidatus Eisenbacteria bacterium]|nr:hypothetical protein [Candidatus Eisenbacteria bacterium]